MTRLFATNRSYELDPGAFCKCELLVPNGYHIVRHGKTRPGDLCMVQLDRVGRQTKIKGEWRIIDAHRIGLPTERFHAVIRYVEINR